MDKKVFTIIITVAAVLILVGTPIYFVFNNRNINKTNSNTGLDRKIEIMTNDEKSTLRLYHLGVYEVVSRSENGGVEAYRFIRMEDEKPIPLEFMSEEEKTSRGLNNSLKIQILQRGENDKILAYKIIKDNKDILSRY